LRVPQFARYRHLLAGFGLVVSGAIIGSAVYMSIFQHNYNLLYVQLHKYMEENADLRRDIDSLNKTRNKMALINVVNVYLVPSELEELPSEDIQKEIEGSVKNDLKLVVGQKAAYVRDARPLYEQLIHQKLYSIHDKNYVIEVKSIVLVQTELSIWITAKEKRT